MQTITTIGFDIAKSVFQVHGVDAAGEVVIRRQLKRRYVLAFFQKLPGGGLDATGRDRVVVSDRLCRRTGGSHEEKEALMNVTAVRVEELDQRITAYDLELVGHDDPPRAKLRRFRTVNCQEYNH